MGEWCATIGLSALVPSFLEYGIDGDVLPQLIDQKNADDIHETLKLNLGQRMKLRTANAELMKTEAVEPAKPTEKKETILKAVVKFEERVKASAEEEVAA